MLSNARIALLLPLACACVAEPLSDPDTQRVEHEQQRASLLTERPDADDWRRRVIYFTVVDRFYNGNPSNDDAHGEADCNDPFNPHAFQGGDLEGLAQRLDYIDALGADSLWITPLYRGVQDMVGINCGFPGYWADLSVPYALELDPRYGSPEQFDTLLEQTHARDIPLMLDMVINHAGYDATIVDQRPEWFNDPETCAAQGSADIYCALAGLPDFDHRIPAVRDYLVDAHRAWLERFEIDAIRMDTVKHVEPEYFTEWTGAMRETQPGMFMVGELLDEHSFGRFDAYLNSGFDGLFNFPLRRALIESFAQGHSVDIAASRMMETLSRFGEDRTGMMVNLLDNHDVPRFLEEIPGWVPSDEAQDRYHLALTALLTLPGIPQIYYGNELGMYGGADPYNRRFMPDWAFSAETRPGARDGYLPAPDAVFDHVQRLLAVRRATPALQQGAYQELWRQNGPSNNNVWAYLRQLDQSSAIVVHNNAERVTDGTVPLGVGDHFADGVVFEDVLGEAEVGPFEVVDGTLSVALPGRSAVILVPDTAPHPIDEMIDIAFEVRASTRWGQSVFVTGDADALGGWDLNDARPLSPSDCDGSSCSWSTSLVLPAGAEVELKFIKIDQALSVQWESGENRPLVVSPESSLVGAIFRS